MIFELGSHFHVVNFAALGAPLWPTMTHVRTTPLGRLSSLGVKEHVTSQLASPVVFALLRLPYLVRSGSASNPSVHQSSLGLGAGTLAPINHLHLKGLHGAKRQTQVHTAGGWHLEVGSLSKCRAFFIKNPLRSRET